MDKKKTVDCNNQSTGFEMPEDQYANNVKEWFYELIEKIEKNTHGYRIEIKSVNTQINW